MEQIPETTRGPYERPALEFKHGKIFLDVAGYRGGIKLEITSTTNENKKLFCLSQEEALAVHKYVGERLQDKGVGGHVAEAFETALNIASGNEVGYEPQCCICNHCRAVSQRKPGSVFYFCKSCGRSNDV